MAAPRLLVTGFGPFPGMPRNPSGGVVRQVAALPRWRIAGVDCRCLVLPTTYAALDAVLEPALAQGADAVLMIGVAGRSRRVRVESRALNRISTLFPDAAGCRPAEIAAPARPALRQARFSPVAAAAILRRQGVAAHVSRDAGRYLCNAAYYRALAGACPVLFIHIPKPPKQRPGRRTRPDRLDWTGRLAFAFAAVGARMLTGAARREASVRLLSRAPPWAIPRA